MNDDETLTPALSLLGKGEGEDSRGGSAIPKPASHPRRRLLLPPPSDGGEGRGEEVPFLQNTIP